MRLVIQRVSHASCTVDSKITGKIDEGFMVLVGFNVNDTKETVIEEGKTFEIEQYNILKENNIYTIEIASFSRSEIMTDYVSLLTSFKILKPSYKVNGDSYEKI